MQFRRAAGALLADFPLWRRQSDQHDPLQPDVTDAGERHPALRWSDQQAAMLDEHLRGALLCGLCRPVRPDGGVPHFGRGVPGGQQAVLRR